MKAGYVPRFSRIERLLHWVNALGFFFLLVTGLILYVPRLSILVSRRQMIQSIHFWGGVGWLGALALVLVLGGRRLLATARDFDAFDRDDLRWLRGQKAPQGRFNAGQKINAVLTAAFVILFAVSGWSEGAFGTWEMNAAKSALGGDIRPRSLIVRIEPHASGEALPLDRMGRFKHWTIAYAAVCMRRAPAPPPI